MTSAAASEARKTTAARVTSSTRPRRPSGMRPSTSALNAVRRRGSGAVIGVSTKVGATAFTRTPCGAELEAAALVSPSTACFVVQ